MNFLILRIGEKIRISWQILRRRRTEKRRKTASSCNFTQSIKRINICTWQILARFTLINTIKYMIRSSCAGFRLHWLHTSGTNRGGTKLLHRRDVFWNESSPRKYALAAYAYTFKIFPFNPPPLAIQHASSRRKTGKSLNKVYTCDNREAGSILE